MENIILEGAFCSYLIWVHKYSQEGQNEAVEIRESKWQDIFIGITMWLVEELQNDASIRDGVLLCGVRVASKFTSRFELHVSIFFAMISCRYSLTRIIRLGFVSWFFCVLLQIYLNIYYSLVWSMRNQLISVYKFSKAGKVSSWDEGFEERRVGRKIIVCWFPVM